MGNSDPMNTPEASAGRVDLDHLSRCLSPSGSRNNAYIGEHFNETPGWSELASEVLRLSALVAELTAANTALVVRNEGARVIIEGLSDGCVCFSVGHHRRLSQRRSATCRRPRMACRGCGMMRIGIVLYAAIAWYSMECVAVYVFRKPPNFSGIFSMCLGAAFAALAVP